MKLCEILMSDEEDVANGWHEWLVIVQEDDRISFRHEYTSPNQLFPKERKVWQDQGSGFYMKDLDTVIAALQSARDRGPDR